MKIFRWIKNIFLKTNVTTHDDSSYWAGSYFVANKKKNSPKWLRSACIHANQCVESENFQREILKVGKFDYSNDTGAQVLTNLLKKEKTVFVDTYKSKNPWSKAIAYTSGQFVYLNARKNPRDIAEMVNTLLHERCHVVGYSHVNNSSAGKENSVPYKIGSIAEECS